MIYEVAVLTIAMEFKMFLGRERLYSPHPITECVRYLTRSENVESSRVKEYICNTEKLYASITGIEFVTLKVSGSYRA